jgi:spermidine synthase
VRRLHFDLRYVQSLMNLDEPDALALAYTQKMAAFLLFQPRPRRIVIVGLGGGSLTKFCYQQLPDVRITTVEIDADVIALASLFRLPAEDARLRIVHGDAADHFAASSDLSDVVLIDGCDDSGTALPFCKPRFYRRLVDRLRPQGLLVINLIGPAERSDAIHEIVDEVFGQRCIGLSVKGGNRILFAFKDPEMLSDWPAIRRRAEELQSRTGLDFPGFARQLQRNRRRDRG